jgi:hypothetical protein
MHRRIRLVNKMGKSGPVTKYSTVEDRKMAHVRQTSESDKRGKYKRQREYAKKMGYKYQYGYRKRKQMEKKAKKAQMNNSSEGVLTMAVVANVVVQSISTLKN